MVFSWCAPSDALGRASPGPQYSGRSTIGPQILSTMPNSTVIKIFSGKGNIEQSTVDAVPGPGAYRPPHQVYSSAVKRLRKKVRLMQTGRLSMQVGTTNSVAKADKNGYSS